MQLPPARSAPDHPTSSANDVPAAAAVGDGSSPEEYFDLNVLKGAVSFNTKPFKHRVLVWIGFKKVLFFPLCWDWWLPRIAPLRFAVGCTLYVLHTACTWLYVRGCLQRPRARPPPGWPSIEDNHVMHIEIILPYVFGILFGIGYGSVVAAGGWEALRLPVNMTGACPHTNPGSRGISSSSGSCGDDSSRRLSLGVSGGGQDASDIPFTEQVRAWDSRAEKEARAANLEDDLDSSDTEDLDEELLQQQQQHRGDAVSEPPVEARPPMGTPSPAPAKSAPMTRSRARNAKVFNSFESSDDGDGDSASPVPVRLRDTPLRSGSVSPVPGTPRKILTAAAASAGRGASGVVEGSLQGNLGGGVESNSTVASNRTAGGGGDDGDSGPASIALVQQQSSISYCSTEDEEEEEDDGDNSGGWGQVVVKPVKVAQWNKKGQGRSKKLMSLNQLRALIIERAEHTPQKMAYHRAAKLGVFATVCLPTLFALCMMIAYAWANANAADNGDENLVGSNLPEDKADFSSLGLPQDSSSSSAVGSQAGGFDGLKLEVLFLEWVWRAARAAWALCLGILRPEAGDRAAAAVSVISLCSVAFVALPAFSALEDAERTYQRRYMYSKYFCALTSSQRARKHRLPHLSLKNVANIRVWLALRAGKTWLRRHRRERRADAVVSSAFYLSLFLLAAILSEAISREARFLSTLVHWELLVWCCFISFFLLRYLTLGSNTNNRYRDTSVLLTEQINVQLRILQNSSNLKPANKARKREHLGVSINVLKLATKLLKELDGPNKLSGLSMNPVLFNVTRIVLVSALSGVMSDTLGFSVKLWKVISFK